jgi:hypothetical protein
MGMQKFLFATGIESSYPVIAGPDGEAYRDLIRTWRGQVDGGFLCL